MSLRFLFLLLFFTPLFANTFTIDRYQDLYLMNELSLYEDKENSLDIEAVLANKDIFTSAKKTNLGIKKYPIWTYNKILNNTDKKLDLIFSNPRAGIDFMDVYIIHDNKVIKKFLLGDMRAQNEREFLYRKSTYALELEPNGVYELVVYYKSFGAIDINWEVYDRSRYVSYISQESLVFGFIAGFIVLISLYIIFIDRMIPAVSHKLYFLILICSLIMQFAVAGIFYQMGIPIYINTIMSWSIGTLAAACIGLFPIYFFDLKKMMPKTTLLLYVLNFITLSFSVLFLFYFLNYDILYLAPISNMIFFLVTFILTYVSIILFLKKAEGYVFYLLGNSAFTASAIYYIFGLLGVVEVGKLFYLSLGIGSVISILFMGMMIAQRLFHIKKDKDDALILINEYTKLSTIGQAMINVSHQWREPINHIHYSINNILAAKEFHDPNLLSIIDASLEDIKKTTSYMLDTGENFLDLYENKNKIEDIDILEIIYFSISIFKKEIDTLKIDLKIDLKEGALLHTDKYLVSNVFLVILENAIKIFKQRKIKNPCISFCLKTSQEQSILIEICDNAGGINLFPIENIFLKDFTDAHSSGIGLFLAKSILNMKLNGDISAQNTDLGACFKVVLGTSLAS